MTTPAQPTPTQTDSHRAAVTAKLAEIPREKLSGMIARTFFGAVFAAFGLACGMGWMFTTKQFINDVLVVEPRVPALVSFGTVIFGAIMASGQITMLPLKYFIAALRDIFSAIRGGGTSS